MAKLVRETGFRLFVDENKAQGLPPGTLGPVQAGRSDVDEPIDPVAGFLLPRPAPQNAFLDWNCWVETLLDPGTVVHKPLPQSSGGADGLQNVDTLGTKDLYSADFPKQATGGPQLVSNGGYTDVIQQCATSTYTFMLKGYGMRFGFPVPVPSLRSVAGVTATPAYPQWTSGNIIVGSYGGAGGYQIPLFYCRWELWYHVSLPPRAAQTPPPNFALQVDASKRPADGVQVPLTQPDVWAVQSVPSKGG